MIAFRVCVIGPSGRREFTAVDRSVRAVLAFVDRAYPERIAASVMRVWDDLEPAEHARRAAALQFLDTTGI